MAPCFATSSVTTELVLVISSAALGREVTGESVGRSPVPRAGQGQSGLHPASLSWGLRCLAPEDNSAHSSSRCLENSEATCRDRSTRWRQGRLSE